MTSSEEVCFVGQTRWVFSVEAYVPVKLIYYAAISHPGVYNIGPVLNVQKYSASSDSSSFAIASERRYALHSPLIVAHAISAAGDNVVSEFEKHSVAGTDNSPLLSSAIQL